MLLQLRFTECLKRGEKDKYSLKKCVKEIIFKIGSLIRFFLQVVQKDDGL